MDPDKTHSSPRACRPGGPGSWGWLAPTLLAAGVAAALSIDVVDSTGGVKGDEATYVAMALSIAHDGDLEYDRRDLSRFYRYYGTGPEGIFLKRRAGSNGRERLYYGKAWLHAVVAAPFVLLFGLNGLLLLNVLLLTCAAVVGYAFLAARSPAPAARAFTWAFFGASILPLYLVWLTPEVLNATLVCVACFVWLRRETVSEDGTVCRWMTGLRADIAAAVLLGFATFSKPPILALAAPIVALCWWRRRFLHAAVAGAVVVLVAGGAFAVNALVTGEFNYQGGERRTFYLGLTGYPYLHDGRFDDGIPVSTNELSLDEPMDTSASALVLARNAGYFLAGRHFGFLPFFFPGVVAAACALRRRKEIEAWQVLLLTALAGAALILLVILPYSWSGGGGPLGNRYFLSFYPAFLFLAAPMRSLRPAICACLGGVVFTAHILVNPFVSARATYVSSQWGALRLLPVELTMVNDLPVNLHAQRRRIPHGQDPEMLLYLLDGNATQPEPNAFWIAGARTADIIVRTHVPLEALELRLRSRVANTVTASAGGPSRRTELRADVPDTIRLVPRGVYAGQAWSYKLTIRSRTGFVPALLVADSADSRYLGVQVALKGVVQRGK